MPLRGSAEGDDGGRDECQFRGNRRRTGQIPAMNPDPSREPPNPRISWWLPLAIVGGLAFWLWVAWHIF
jgi:hypothetical protein